MTDAELIATRLAAAGMEVSAAPLEKLAAFLVFLDRWNGRINLTGSDQPRAEVDRLIVEPVVAASTLPTTCRTLLDLGSGGGSPAIPLKIMRPDVCLTMVEARTRKCVFLREASRHLDLSLVDVHTDQFQRVLAGGPGKPWDAVSVRAVKMGLEELTAVRDALSGNGRLLWFVGADQLSPLLPPGLEVVSVRRLVPLLRSHLLVIRKG